jgi:hypothetical protein
MLHNTFLNILKMKKTEMAYGREEPMMNFTVKTK